MDVLFDVLLAKFPVVGTVIKGVLSTAGLFAFLATLTPNTSSAGKIVSGALKVINFLGCNFGKAKNK